MDARKRYLRWESEYIRPSAYAESIERVAQGVRHNMARHLKKLSPRR